jgi:hypothetical protein
MKLVIEPMNTLPCRLEVFAINGKNANQNDFVYAYDHDIENAETDTCSDMQLEFKFITKEILDKYNITEEEYRFVKHRKLSITKEGKKKKRIWI